MKCLFDLACSEIRETRIYLRYLLTDGEESPRFMKLILSARGFLSPRVWLPAVFCFSHAAKRAVHLSGPFEKAYRSTNIILDIIASICMVCHFSQMGV